MKNSLHQPPFRKVDLVKDYSECCESASFYFALPRKKKLHIFAMEHWSASWEINLICLTPFSLFSPFVQIIDCGLMGKFMLIMDKIICLLFVFYPFLFLSEVILQLNSFST